MAFGANIRRSIILTFLVAFCTSVTAFAPLQSDQPLAFQNLTRTIEKIETDPTFLSFSNHLLYLQRGNNYASPAPWDNCIVLYDLERGHDDYVSESGILKYRIADDESHVQLLRVTAAVEFDFWEDIDFTAIRDWEISALNLKTLEEKVVERSSERSLSEGLQMLGFRDYVFGDQQTFAFESPQKNNRVVVERKQVEDRDYWLYKMSNQEESLVFVTEVWNSYGHSYWTPKVLWLNETTFITLGFKSNPEAELPQGSGEFTIVRVDLEKKSHEELYLDRYINPFTELVYNSYSSRIYFHRFDRSIGKAEILSFNLNQYDTNPVYSVFGEVWGMMISKDGLKMVFTLILENNSDIIKVDLQNESQLKFAGN